LSPVKSPRKKKLREGKPESAFNQGPSKGKKNLEVNGGERNCLGTIVYRGDRSGEVGRKCSSP